MFNYKHRLLVRILYLYPLLVVLSIMAVSYCSDEAAIVFDKNMPKQSHILRPPSSKNGHSTPPSFSTPTPPAVQQRPKRPRDPGIDGAVTTVLAYVGIVGARPEGRQEVLVPAGTKLTVEIQAIPGRLAAEDTEGLPDEFGGSLLDRVRAVLTVLHRLFPDIAKPIEGFKTAKVLEINTDLLPDPALDQYSRAMAEGILDTIAHRVWEYGKDVRFSRRLYVDFRSRKGDTDGERKKQALMDMFRQMDFVTQYELTNGLYSEKDIGPVGPLDRLTITNQDDKKPFANPALMLGTELLIDNQAAVYPWQALMDLSVRILSFDRSGALDEQRQTYDAIRDILRQLRGAEISDVVLARFLGHDIAQAVGAAFELALPPIEKISLDSIEDLNRIVAEVARAA